MDVVVTGRHLQVTDRFRQHVEERIGKIEQLAPRALRIEVLASHEPTRRQSNATERVEITVHVRGPVIRAESCHDDKYAAFDQALVKLLERLRRANDRRRVHRGRHTPESVAAATARTSQANGVSPAALSASSHGAEEPDLFGAVGDSPIEVREKIHQSHPMSLAEALREMELVGHDFFLFHDSETGKPSVVYRRRAWSYGVIHLDVEATADGQPNAEVAAS